MKDHATPFIKTQLSKFILILSLLISMYWLLGQLIHVYSQAIVGAIFEILWLPAIAMTFILPALSFMFLVKEKFDIRSLYLYSILIISITLLAIKFIAQ